MYVRRRHSRADRLRSDLKVRVIEHARLLGKDPTVTEPPPPTRLPRRATVR
jgi:hypothetical protein